MNQIIHNRKLKFTHTQSTITNVLSHLIHLKLWEYIKNDNDIDSIQCHGALDSKTLKNDLFKRKLNNSFSPSMSTMKIFPQKPYQKITQPTEFIKL